MAIHPNSTAPSTQNAPGAALTVPIDIETWTEQATQSLNAVSLGSPKEARGTSRSLAISLDEKAALKQERNAEDVSSAYRPRREPLRRDSLKRREALLKGKEGSRRRIRWENDRLLNNPWAQPPLPSDWEIQATHPKHNVPYYLAPLWDQDYALRAAAEERKRNAARKQSQTSDENAGKVPRELRDKLKKAKAAKGLLKDLEEQVRSFVKNLEDDTSKNSSEDPELDSEDEEIVFVGRNGHMHDMPPSPTSTQWVDKPKFDRNRLVFDSLVNDHGASFGRWLVHSIASYYGLHTWSITVGDPARREAYVGIPPHQGNDRPPSPILHSRPLWGMV